MAEFGQFWSRVGAVVRAEMGSYSARNGAVIRAGMGQLLGQTLGSY